MATGTNMTPMCGHEEHVPGCGHCDAGMERLQHAIALHGLYAAECPNCDGNGCGDGNVFAFPIAPGACGDGIECLLLNTGANN